MEFFILRWQQPSDEWRGLPPREAELVVELGRPFNPSEKFNMISGMVQIIKAPQHLQDLEGLPLLLSKRYHLEEEEWIRSTQIRIRGVLSYFDEQTASSSFQTYLNRRGIFLELRRGLLVEIVREADHIFSFFANENKRLEQFLRLGGKSYNDEQDVMTAMLLGNRAGLSEEQKVAFQSTGTFHFFAVSGLHIGVIAFLLFYLLTLFRIPRKVSIVIGLTVLLLYVYIIGAQPSALRAFSMIGFFWSAYIFQHKPSPFSALLASSLLVLLIQPNELWNVGFQLSYLIVASILLYGLPLTKLLHDRLKLFTGLPDEDWCWHHHFRQNILNGISGLFAISLSAWLMSAPLSLAYFNIYAPGGILANLLLVPLISVAIVVGFSSLLLGVVGLGGFCFLFNHASWLLIGWIETILEGMRMLPGLFSRDTFSIPELVWPVVWGLTTILVIGHSRRFIHKLWFYGIAPIALFLILFVVMYV